MIAVLVGLIGLLVVDAVATTALLAVVLKRSGYRVALWPDKKPSYYA